MLLHLLQVLLCARSHIHTVFDAFVSVVLLEKSLVDKVEEKKGAGGTGKTVNLHF